MAPALPFKELNRSLFIPTGFGQVLNDVRFRELRMFLTIHGSIFHDEVGHLRGNPLRKIHNLRYLYTPEIKRWTESPCRARNSQSPVSSVGVLKETAM
jgi:hypothetical protein